MSKKRGLHKYINFDDKDFDFDDIYDEDKPKIAA